MKTYNSPVTLIKKIEQLTAICVLSDESGDDMLGGKSGAPIGGSM